MSKAPFAVLAPSPTMTHTHLNRMLAVSQKPQTFVLVLDIFSKNINIYECGFFFNEELKAERICPHVAFCLRAS